MAFGRATIRLPSWHGMACLLRLACSQHHSLYLGKRLAGLARSFGLGWVDNVGLAWERRGVIPVYLERRMGTDTDGFLLLLENAGEIEKRDRMGWERRRERREEGGVK